MFDKVKKYLGVGIWNRKVSDISLEKELSSRVGKDTSRFNFESEAYRKKSDLIKYEKIYVKDGVIFSAINSLTRAVVGCQWDISGSEAVRDEVGLFIKNMHFQKFLDDLVRYVLIFGDVFIERVSNNKGEFVDLNICDTKSVEIQTDDQGEEVLYIQNVSNESLSFTPEEMIHFNLYTLPSTPYGISVIGANYDIKVKKIKVDEAITSAILHHGFPKFHVSVGSAEEDILPSKNDIDSIADNFKDINSKNEFITPDIIDIKNIDSRGIDNIEEYTSYFLNLITAGFGVPEEQLGLGKGSTEASGKVRQRLFERNIRSIQASIEEFISDNIFDTITEDTSEKVRLQFRDISPSEEVEIIKWLEPLIKTDEGTFGIIGRNEIRKLFHMPVEEEETKEPKKSENIKDKEIEKSKTDEERIEDIIDNGYSPEDLYGNEFEAFKDRFNGFKKAVKKEVKDTIEKDEY